MPGAAVRWTHFLTAVIGLLLVGPIAPVSAQQKIRVEIESSSFQSRTNGPIPLRLLVEWGGTRLAKGVLHVDFHASDDMRPLARYLLPATILTPGRNELFLTVAPLALANYESEATVQFAWEFDGQLETPPPQVLRVPGQSKRTFLIATIRPSIRVQSDRDQFRWLALESWLSPDWKKEELRIPFQTLFAGLDADRMPADPNNLLAYDILGIGPRELANLSADQTGAIWSWLEAGGAACVIVNGATPYEPHQIDFLNRVSGNAKPPRFAVGTGNKLALASPDESAKAERFHVGWGRAAIVTLPKDELELGSSEDDHNLLVKLTDWLWRLSKRESESLWDTGHLTLRPDVKQYSQRNFAASYQVGFTTSRPWSVPSDYLFPSTVRPVPGWLLATILGGFVLAIGPGDYLLLGAIRKRRWTWILLPLVTLGVTQLVITCSNSYLGQSERLSKIELRDIGTGGRIARKNQLSFLVPAQRGLFRVAAPTGMLTTFSTDGTLTDNQFGAVWTPNGRVRQYPGVAPRSYQNMSGASYQGVEVTPSKETPEISVASTQRELAIPVERWSPVMFRSLSIPRVETERLSPGKFDWDRPGDLRLPEVRERVLSALQAEYGNAICVVCSSHYGTLINHIYPGCSTEEARLTSANIGGLIPSSSPIREVVQQSAPSGSGTFEDLESGPLGTQMSVNAEDDELTLQVVAREKDMQVVYRKIYRVSDLAGDRASAP
jgi:hypothetical protein